MELRNDKMKPWNNDVLVVRYEDLAAEPYKMADKIYRFLDMSFPQVVHDWIRLHTSNSTQKALRWKHDLGWKVIKTVQDLCPKTFEHFGYRKIKSNLERNKTETVEKMGCVECNW